MKGYAKKYRQTAENDQTLGWYEGLCGSVNPETNPQTWLAPWFRRGQRLVSASAQTK